MSLLKIYSIERDIDKLDVDEGKLQGEIIADGCVTNLSSVNRSGDSLKIYGDSFTEADLDNVVKIHVYYDLDEYVFLLAEYVKTKISKVDTRTVELILEGFTFDSKVFSLSTHAQSNWDNIKVNQSEFTFPKDITTIHDETYSLAVEDIGAFWSAKQTKIDEHLGTGRTLKDSLRACETVVDVDEINDVR